MSLMNTGNFAELLWPGIKTLFGNTYNELPPLWPKMVDIIQSDKAFEKHQGITNFGLLSRKDQGSALSYQRMFQGFTREIVNVAYSTGAVITEELLDDEQYSVFKRIPTDLAKAVRKTEETIAAGLLNSGFSTSPASIRTNAADGLSLFNGAHLLVAGATTFRNTPATPSDLTQTALENAYIDLANFVDDQGLPIMAMPKVLIVPTASQFVAARILETQYEVDTANNAINPVSKANVNVDLIVNPYLTDSDSWFIKTNIENGLVWQERKAARIDSDVDFETKDLRFSVTRRFGAGAVDPRGYYGSPGA